MNTISGLSYYGGSKEPMADIIATGQVSIVDLTDNHTLSCYISANLPRTQVYDQGSKTYRPDWSADPHLV